VKTFCSKRSNRAKRSNRKSFRRFKRSLAIELSEAVNDLNVNRML
jgi:hypothetical protein